MADVQDLAVGLAECKAYLRLDGDNEDALIAGFIRTAMALCEAFTGTALSPDWNAVPEPLRQGIVRLVAHLFSHRDAADAGPPPTAVAALWRPYRQMRL